MPDFQTMSCKEILRFHKPKPKPLAGFAKDILCEAQEHGGGIPWLPCKVSLREMIRLFVRFDLEIEEVTEDGRFFFSQEFEGEELFEEGPTSWVFRVEGMSHTNLRALAETFGFFRPLVVA